MAATVVRTTVVVGAAVVGGMVGMQETVKEEIHYYCMMTNISYLSGLHNNLHYTVMTYQLTV